MADPWTLLAAVASGPVALGVAHFARWLAPIVLPAFFSRAAPVQQMATSNEGRIADLERRISNAEDQRTRDRDRAEDRHAALLEVLGDIRHDARVARRRAAEESET